MSTLRRTWQERLRGALIAAAPIPFDSTGRMVDEAHRAYVGYMNDQPADGVAIWAHTGRGLDVSREIRLRVIDAWRAGLPADRFVVAGVGGVSASPAADRSGDVAYIDHAVQMATDARDHGAEAVLVFAPVRFRGRDDQDDRIVEYHRAIADVGLPVILFYLYEAAGGISYSLNVIRALTAIEQVAAIKMATLDSVMTFQDVAQLLRQEAADVSLITGEDRFMGYSLMCGATGALVGMGAACTAMQKELVTSHLAGEGDRFLALSRQVDAFAQVTFFAPMEGYIQRMLWALCHLGVIDRSACCDPWGPALPAGEFDQLKRVMQDIGQLR